MLSSFFARTKGQPMLRRDVHTCAGVWTPLEKGQCEGPCCAAHQDAAPPTQPSSLHPVLHQNGCCPRFGLGQTPQEFCSLTPPVFTARTTSRSAFIFCQFRVASFVLHACSNATLASSNSSPRGAVGHHRCVNGQLGALEQVSIRDDFNPSAIEPSELGQIQVADENVRHHPGTCFPAHLCRRTLQRIAPSTQDPCLRARCTMMAK